MKATRFRDMSEEELWREEREITEQLFKLRFQSAIGQAEHPQKLRSARRDLARVKTRLRLLQIQQAAAGKTGE